MTEIFKELHKGIDSLYLSFRGTLKEGLRDELEQKKTFAQSDDENEQALAAITIDEHTFEVKDKGKGRYAYVLVDGWFHIQVSGNKTKRLPSVYVQLSSDLLNGFGLYNAMNQLRGVIKELLSGADKEIISRADLFVDFTTNTNLGSISKRAWVTRARSSQSHWMGDTFTGLSIGLGGDISARLYNKTIEIEKSRKDYLKAVWEKNGWDKMQDVWRLEFQLKRIVLKQMSVNTVDELIENSNDIWRYCTQEWLRLAVENSNKNITRWKTHPLWTAIEQVRFGAGTYTGILRDVSRSRTPNMKALYLNCMGYMTNYAAHKGYDDLNEKVVLEFFSEAKEFLKEYTANSPIYDNPDVYTKTKIKLKKKRYNKPIEENRS